MMDILSVALSGLNASRNRALVAANNLANLNTPGYRAQEADTFTGSGGSEAVTGGVSSLDTMGPLIPTDNPLDLAIGGAGFFPITNGNGNAAYTRDGAFTVGANGTLVNSQGLELQPPITVPAGATNVSVGNDGTVSAQLPNGGAANLGQIQLATFSNPSGLNRDGGNLLTPSGSSGIAQPRAPGTGGRGFIQSGFLEGSNVDIAQQAINLGLEENVTKANVAVAKTADEMMKTILDIKA